MIASCSRSILTHDIENPKPLLSFAPHAGSINSVVWNHNNQVLASCGSDGKILLSHSIKGDILHTFEEKNQSQNASPVNSLSFTSGSLQLASGAGDGRVRVYNLKNKQILQTYSAHIGGVTCVDWHANDTLLASSSQVGDIHLYNIDSEDIVTSFRESCSVQQIKFSPFRSHQLASCAADGKVAVWDVNARNSICSFAKHAGKANAIAFSTHNQILLCSASLDARINFYDIHEKKVVKTLQADAPLTSLAFHSDGHTIIVGTLYGDLLVFDLRQGSEPKNQLQGHQQNQPIAAISVTKASNKNKTAPPLPPGNNSLKQSAVISKFSDQQNKLNESVSSIKSRTSDGLPPTNPGKFSMLSTETNRMPADNVNVLSEKESSRSQSNSKIQGNQSLGKPSQSLGPTPKASQILNNGQNNININNNNNNNNYNFSNVSTANGVNPQNSTIPSFGATNNQFINNGSTKNSSAFKINQQRTEEDELKSGGAASQLIKNNSNKHLLSPSNNVISPDFQSANKASTVIERQTGKSMLTPQISSDQRVNGEEFTERQKMTIRSMLDDQQMDMKIYFSEQLSNLHIELIRQFQIQQNEMSSMLESYLIQNKTLEDKVAQLKSENDRLKKSSY